MFDANHDVIDTLKFAGTYSKADFALQRNGTATEIVYAGTTSSAGAMPLPDFLPHSPGWGASPIEVRGAGQSAILRDAINGQSEFAHAVLQQWHGLRN